MDKKNLKLWFCTCIICTQLAHTDLSPSFKINPAYSGWSPPSSLSPPFHWHRNILDCHGQPPLVKGQLGVSLGEKKGKYTGGLFTIVSALEAWAPTACSQGRIHHQYRLSIILC